MKASEISNNRQFTDINTVRGGSDYDSGDEESRSPSRNHTAPREREEDIEDDNLYSGEIGYWLIKTLRGPTSGRQMKRNYFKLGFFNWCCGWVLLVITLQIDRTFPLTSYYQAPRFGIPLQTLMWMTALPSVFLATCSFLCIRYWASLCTNRDMLINLSRMYMIGSLFIFFFNLYCVIVWFLEFQGVAWNRAGPFLLQMLPMYIFSIIFCIIHGCAIIIYVLDIWFVLDGIVLGEDIEEPDPPANIMDLSDVSFQQICLFFAVIPCVFAIQVMDFINAYMRFLQRYCAYRRRVATDRHLHSQERDQHHRGKRTLCGRIAKTLHNRWVSLTWCCRRDSSTLSASSSSQVPGDKQENELADTEFGEGQQQQLRVVVDRELQERLERERIEEEKARRAEARAEAAKRQLQEEEMRRTAAANEELRRQQLEAEASLKKAQEEAEIRRQQEAEAAARAPVLTLKDFKALWGALDTGGAFQAKIKMQPSMTVLTEHFQKQGFHIVFTSGASSAEIEIGVCNIRQIWHDNSAGASPTPEAWFLARFLASSTHFSAVMKATDQNIIKGFVKKFLLAKVLKMDTTAN